MRWLNPGVVGPNWPHDELHGSAHAGGRVYETGGTGATTTRFLYDGANIVAEYDTSGNVLRRYVQGLSGPIVWYEGSGMSSHRWLIPNERGSIIARDNAGTVSINSYDEYGQNGSSNAGRFQYAGTPWIAETGIYHTWAHGTMRQASAASCKPTRSSPAVA